MPTEIVTQTPETHKACPLCGETENLGASGFCLDRVECWRRWDQQQPTMPEENIRAYYKCPKCHVLHFIHSEIGKKHKDLYELKDGERWSVWGKLANNPQNEEKK